MARSRTLLGILHGSLRRRSRDAERAIEIVEAAANVAWFCHAGIFVLPFAERLLREHAGLADPLAKPDPMTRSADGRTLHVLTEVYPVGGHTRLVKRWIEGLDDEPHAVVLVRQRMPLDPSWLVPEGRDVPLIDLERAGGGRRARVARLVALFRAARRVILHIHPDDACSVAAAYRSPDAEIHFLNHADHVAWLGAGLPVVFLNLRHRGTRLAETRRGIDVAACGEVPVPIARPLAASRDDARRHLGIGSHEHLILTVASGYKFNPVDGRSLLEPLGHVLRRRDVRLMAVGVEPDHPLFAPLAARHPGRVLCLGNIPAPTLHRAAADVYLDSYPFCSITSMLESAAMGTPVAAYQPDPEELGILYSECPWLRASEYAASDAGTFGDLLEALLDDPSRRQDLSAHNVEGMAMHHPDAWRAAVRKHLARSFAASPWRGQGIRFEERPVDHVLAGLTHDLTSRTRDPRRLRIDAIGRMQVSFWKRLGWL